jgi:hypothetical protein
MRVFCCPAVALILIMMTQALDKRLAMLGFHALVSRMANQFHCLAAVNGRRVR